MKTLLQKINPFKHKPKFNFGEKDKEGFCQLIVDDKPTNIKVYHFPEYDINNLQEIAKQLYEQKRF